MSRILLQTTIPLHPDDWDISRFSLLADELRSAGHEVIARNRMNRLRIPDRQFVGDVACSTVGASSSG